jgi:ribonuclease BN (tRNA processing enzyme)
MHIDHFIDIIQYSYGLKLMSGLADGFRPELLLPPGGMQTLSVFTSPWKDLFGTISEMFRVREFDPSATTNIGNCQITFAPTVHYVPCWAIRVVGRKTLVYSSDTGPSEQLVEIANQADLFVVEAAFMEKGGVPGEEGHLTPSEAGLVARRAGVRRLLLTHFWQEFDAKRMIREAGEAYGGPAELAEEWKSYVL